MPFLVASQVKLFNPCSALYSQAHCFNIYEAPHFQIHLLSTLPMSSFQILRTFLWYMPTNFCTVYKKTTTVRSGHKRSLIIKNEVHKKLHKHTCHNFLLTLFLQSFRLFRKRFTQFFIQRKSYHHFFQKQLSCSSLETFFTTIMKICSY